MMGTIFLDIMDGLKIKFTHAKTNRRVSYTFNKHLMFTMFIWSFSRRLRTHPVCKRIAQQVSKTAGLILL